MSWADTPVRIRNRTEQRVPHYECRVIREVQRGQAELTQSLQLLADNTPELITYKKFGSLGVTLAMLEPVLRKILPANRRGAISRDDLREFESELVGTMARAQFTDYDIRLNSFSELALYGKDKQYLALELDQRDLRLEGERAMIEQYIRNNYDQEDGSRVSKRFMSKNLSSLKPHITIGHVERENFSEAEYDAFVADPTTFMVQRADERMHANFEEYGGGFEPREIIFPETVTLGGLRIFCQQKN